DRCERFVERIGRKACIGLVFQRGAADGFEFCDHGGTARTERAMGSKDAGDGGRERAGRRGIEQLRARGGFGAHGPVPSPSSACGNGGKAKGKRDFTVPSGMLVSSAI